MKIEVRENKVILDGYVNAVERFSKPLLRKDGRKFIERIMPNVFQRALEKNDDVKVLLNHDFGEELANTKDGTARLCEDNIGLRATLEITNEKVIEKAKKKKLKGWSFGFICNKEEEKENENGLIERTVRDIDLFEVSIIDDRKIPAYVGTSIEMRDSSGSSIKEIEYRNEELEEPANIEELTSSQKRELLCGEYRKIYQNGWLEDYDEHFVYGTTQEGGVLYKTPYSITNSEVTFNTDNQVKVIRGGYKEVRNDNGPEQHPKEEVGKIDYSNYLSRIENL